MEKEYLKFVLDGMAPMFDAVTDLKDHKFLMAATMCRFLNCDSLLDLSEVYHINRKSLYKSVDAISPGRWMSRLRKAGRKRIINHLKKWHAGDPSWRTRHAITLCADDFTRNARGELGHWMGLFYSGAEKGVVPGINLEVLAAAIGDGAEVIILDVRIVPPKPDGGGRLPATRNAWLRKALADLNSFVRKNGTNFEGCSLSVDAAYVSPENVTLAKSIGIDMVGKLSIKRNVEGKVWGKVIFCAPCDIFAGVSIYMNPERCHPMRGEPDVEYHRKVVSAPSLKREIVLVAFIHEEDLLLYFSTNTQMKTITLRNTIRYRWQLERIFWILKQDIGIGDIHHHSK
ncbi:MAG: hypothetical protein Q8O19_05650, partial [Rectinemataceae bacterium]|nr:hypothetical protein [Rectinemataceae bacterium]